MLGAGRASTSFFSATRVPLTRLRVSAMRQPYASLSPGGEGRGRGQQLFFCHAWCRASIHEFLFSDSRPPHPASGKRDAPTLRIPLPGGRGEGEGAATLLLSCLVQGEHPRVSFQRLASPSSGFG